MFVNTIHRESQELVEAAHPLGVTLGQVVIDGDHVDAFARKCVEIDGQCCHEGFTFTRGHLGDLAGMQHHATDELHIVMAHVPGNHVAACGPGVAVIALVTLNLYAVVRGRQVAVHIGSRHLQNLVLLEPTRCLLHHGESLRQDLLQNILGGLIDLVLQLFNLFVEFLFLFNGEVVVGVKIFTNLRQTILFHCRGFADGLTELDGLVP